MPENQQSPTFDTQTTFVVGQCEYAACELTEAGFPPTQAGAEALDRQLRRGTTASRRRRQLAACYARH